MTVQLTDKATVTSRIADSRGLRVKAVFSRVGIQRYTARELGLQGRPPGDILRIFRPEEEVFAQDSLDSFENVPVTDDHPGENVTSLNVRKYGVGIAVGKRERQGDHTVGEILVQDAAAIAKIDNGKIELSDGYACEIDMQPGEWNGQPYDGVKRNIRGNHVAIVGAGRCGGTCRILDGEICEACASQDQAPCNCHESENHMSTGGQASPQLVPRLFDGLTIQTTEQGAQAIDRLTAQLADARAETQTAAAALAAAQTEHATAISAKDGEITGLKAQVTDEALDARVAERANLVSTVTALLGKDYDTKGKTNVQMMTDVAMKAYGAEAVKDRDPSYIEALFTTVKKPAADRQDTIRSTVTDGLNPAPTRRQNVQMRDSDNNDGPRGRDAYLAKLRGGRDFGARKQGSQ